MTVKLGCQIPQVIQVSQCFGPPSVWHTSKMRSKTKRGLIPVGRNGVETSVLKGEIVAEVVRKKVRCVPNNQALIIHHINAIGGIRGHFGGGI